MKRERFVRMHPAVLEANVEPVITIQRDVQSPDVGHRKVKVLGHTVDVLNNAVVVNRDRLEAAW